MKDDILSKLENMSEGETILFIMGLELKLGLTTWDEIIRRCEEYNRDCLDKYKTNECPHEMEAKKEREERLRKELPKAIKQRIDAWFESKSAEEVSETIEKYGIKTENIKK